jgi:molybdate/tungstate transport system substrate-binding protein
LVVHNAPSKPGEIMKNQKTKKVVSVHGFPEHDINIICEFGWHPRASLRAWGWFPTIACSADRTDAATHYENNNVIQYRERLQKSFAFTLLFLWGGMMFAAGCEQRDEASSKNDELSGKLVIFHAGSLAVPFKQLADEFTRENPSVRVLREVAGSRECARKICDLGKICDVIATADSKVIKNLLIPKYTDWYVEFAHNELVVVYNPKTVTGITVENLPDKLLECSDLYRADPDLDPCGYRTLMVWQLMQSYYQRPGLYGKLLEKSPANKVRPKETDILALLESGQVDCFFIYRSVAEQHKLNYLVLPDEVNLSQPSLAKTYSQAQVEVTGAKPGTTLTRIAEPIVYGITIPNNAEQPELAEAFLRFVLSEQGRSIMQDNGQGVLQNIVPAEAPRVKKLLSKGI